MTIVGTKCVGCLGGFAYIEGQVQNVLLAPRRELWRRYPSGGGFRDAAPYCEFNRMIGATSPTAAPSLPTMPTPADLELLSPIPMRHDRPRRLKGNEVKNAQRGTNIVKDLITEQVGGYSGYKIGFFGKAPVIRQGAYTVTNPARWHWTLTPTTLPQVATVLGTLVADLTALGLLGSSP